MLRSAAARDVAIVGLLGGAVLYYLGETWPAVALGGAAVAWIAIDGLTRRRHGNGR